MQSLLQGKSLRGFKAEGNAALRMDLDVLKVPARLSFIAKNAWKTQKYGEFKNRLSSPWGGICAILGIYN